MELKDYFKALKRGWWIVLIASAAGLIIATLVTLALPKVYEAETELFIGPKGGTTSTELMQGSDFVLSRVKSYVQVLDQGIVLDPVIETLDLDTTVTDLAEDITASVVEDTVVVVVAARSDSPDEAAEIANAIAEQFVEIVPSLEPLRGSESGVVQVTITDPARPPLSPDSPQPLINSTFGLLVGLAVGVAGALARRGANSSHREPAAPGN